MRVFIDTNILIDFVVNREGFSEDAYKLFALGILTEAHACLFHLSAGEGSVQPDRIVES